MDIWVPLIAVVIGGLIATIPILMNNRFQAREREKDRLEQKREAKIQLTLELLRNDMKIIEGSIDNELKSVNIINALFSKKTSGKFSDEIVMDEVKSAFVDPNSKLFELGESDIIADKLAYSFGDEFYSEHKNFRARCGKYWVMCSAPSLYTYEDRTEVYLEVATCAGKLHTMMNEKLISVRDT